MSVGKALTIALAITVLAYTLRLTQTWGGDWKTQTVLYQNLQLSTRTVEFQMQDVGARGYNRRTVDRIKLFPYIDWIKDVEEAHTDTLNWEKVDLEVNELGLKGG